ncbi:hypothetical protein G6N76_09505 [Rhizobium daejeonense]|uniref:Uncharacterized protein n=1 Tax=Rhizobium daejeonense TaxID=240521 RepID=A0A6M1S0Y4_9HYPH|nr:hypothetical protein [Rhizobium daejeonense]NGO63911.1 hypothetical protein [Rhizobium daejeonense]
MTDIVEQLNEACNGHPAATIPWPHRLLHSAADEITRLRRELTEARNAALEEAAEIIDANCIMDTSGGKTLSPRQDGNRDGLYYAAAIRSLKEKAE